MIPERQNEGNGPYSVQILADAISHAIHDNDGNKRFVDLARLPLICLSITGIHESLKKIEGKLETNYVTKEAFDPVKNLVFGFISLVLVTVVGAILVLVIK